jgi:hypothetical protein
MVGEPVKINTSLGKGDARRTEVFLRIQVFRYSLRNFDRTFAFLLY